jgi:hypothetical protein
VPVIHRLPVPEPFRQVPPRAPGPGPEEDPVDDQPVIIPPVPLPWMSRQQRPQPRPLAISQVMPAQPLIIHTAIQTEIPGKIYETRALHAASPAEEVWLPTETREASYGGDIYASGMNAARGQSALVLGDLLLADRDGHRTALVVPSLQELVGDPSVSVRSCVGHLLLACRRHARPESTAAFWRLIETDDRLLATQPVMDLIIYIGNDDPPRLQPVIERMLNSEYPAVREAGGKQAAFAGLEFGLDGLLAAARQAPDGSIRKGAAEVCARRLGGTADPVNATAALSQFFTDDDEGVRKSAAQASLTLRGQALRPFADLLSTLIQSPSFTDALSALLMTLEQAPDRIDDLAISCAKRFLQEHGSQVGDLSTAAAGQAQGVGRLILRAYAQATTPAGRATVLDLVDELLMNSAYDSARGSSMRLNDESGESRKRLIQCGYAHGDAALTRSPRLRP